MRQGGDDKLREFLMRQTLIRNVKKRYSKTRRGVVQLGKLVKDTIATYPVFNAIEEILQQGGLNYKALRKNFGKEQVKELMRKRPCIVSFKGKARLDDIAHDHGFESDDALLNLILDTPSKKAIVTDIRTKMEVDILKRLELAQRKFEPTDGIYPDTLYVGDEIYMQGFYTVIGFTHDTVILQGGDKVELSLDEKLPCEAVKRKRS